MREIDLQGLRVTLSDPIQISQGVGHHWFPHITRFPSGELWNSVSVVADAHSILARAQAIYISFDGGQSWEHRYTLTEAGRGRKVVKGNGDIQALGHVYPDPPGQWRTFSGNYMRYGEGGRLITIESQGMRLEGLPRDIEPYTPDKVFPGTANPGQQLFNGDGFEFEGRLLTTMYGRFAGDPLYTCFVVVSEDDGRTWRYLSTIASAEDVPGSVKEGPCEPSMIPLETGELMCVMRVGGGSQWNLARAYSGDGGRTWSKVDRLPAFSVEPWLRQLSNGTIIISTGRIGINLWLSTDPRGESWQKIDIVAHHNQWAPGSEHTIIAEKPQTTAYTEFIEIEPNRLLLVYDRTPFGWKPVPIDSDERNRIYALPIEVELV